MEVSPPEVPDERLGDLGWERTEERTETLLDGVPVHVVGRTLVYTNGAGTDRSDTPQEGSTPVERFFFATRLAFRPSLPGVTGAASIRPAVETSASEAFAADLRERGLTDVCRERRERMRVDTSERATLLAYRADRPLTTGDVPVAGLLAVWVREGQFRLAGGAYPERARAADDDASDTRAAYRDELLDLIRAVA